MGSELVSDESPQEGGGNTAFSYTKAFQTHLPYYLSIGMSYEDYWYGDCTLVKYYREADKINKERKNQELWLQGLYFYQALASSLGMFTDEGSQPYLDSPIPLTEKDAEDRKEQEEKLKYEQNMATMNALMKNINSSIARKEKS